MQPHPAELIKNSRSERIEINRRRKEVLELQRELNHLETIKEEVAKRCMKVFVDSCSIEKAKLGGQAGVLGAAALAIME